MAGCSSSPPKTSFASLALVFTLTHALVHAPGSKYILVGPVDIINGNDGQVTVIPEVTEGNARAGLDVELVDLLLGNIECDGHGEESAIGQADVLNNSVERELAMPATAFCKEAMLTHCSPSRS
jgi:hypothetical protein